MLSLNVFMFFPLSLLLPSSVSLCVLACVQTTGNEPTVVTTGVLNVLAEFHAPSLSPVLIGPGNITVFGNGTISGGLELAEGVQLVVDGVHGAANGSLCGGGNESTSAVNGSASAVNGSVCSWNESASASASMTWKGDSEATLLMSVGTGVLGIRGATLRLQGTVIMEGANMISVDDNSKVGLKIKYRLLDVLACWL